MGIFMVMCDIRFSSVIFLATKIQIASKFTQYKLFINSRTIASNLSFKKRISLVLILCRIFVCVAYLCSTQVITISIDS